MNFYDPDTGCTYIYKDIKEPAPTTSPKTGKDYGKDAKLPPGQYELNPREDDGPVLQKGHPLYTTPGQKTGVVIDPDGKERTYIGPHYGTESLGCPLMPSLEQSKSLNFLINYYEQFGGTTINVYEK